MNGAGHDIVARQSKMTPRTLSRRWSPRRCAASLPRRRRLPGWHRSACRAARRTPPASSSPPARGRRQCRRQRQPARGRPPDRRSPARYRCVVRDAPWPPASVPCAIRMSAPASSACRAISSLCTWQISNAPAALIFGANGAGSPNDSMIARGLASSAMSSKLGLLRETPGDEADAERTGEIFQLRGLRFEPGAIAIAAAKNAEAAGCAHRPGQPRARRSTSIGASRIGCRMPRSAVKWRADRHASLPRSGQQA